LRAIDDETVPLLRRQGCLLIEVANMTVAIEETKSSFEGFSDIILDNK
jgi:hypothetical protein